MTNRDRSYKDFGGGVERIGISEAGQPIILANGYYYLLPVFIVLSNQVSTNAKLRLSYRRHGYAKSIGFRDGEEFEEALSKLLTLVENQGHSIYRNVAMTMQQKRVEYIFGHRIPKYVYKVAYNDGFIIRRSVYTFGSSAKCPQQDCGVFYDGVGLELAMRNASEKSQQEIDTYNRSMRISKKTALEKWLTKPE